MHHIFFILASIVAGNLVKAASRWDVEGFVVQWLSLSPPCGSAS